MTLGERVNFVRKNNKLNQQDFAKLLGISQTHVSKIEHGIENPSETLLLFISYKFAVNINWLKEEQGSYNGLDSCSAESYFEKLIYVRHKIEKKASYMNTDSIWEYVDSIIYFEKLLDCCDNDRVNDRPVTLYYKRIGKLMYHLTLLTEESDDTQKATSRKEQIKKDINDIVEAYREI